MLMERRQGPKPSSATMGDGRRSEPRFATGSDEVPPVHLGGRGLHEDDIAQIVHDLRDPLAMIALETYALDRKLAIGDHSDVRRRTSRILSNVELLDRAVQDLLDGCAIGEGHLEIHRKATELRALLERVIDRMVSTCDRGRVTLDAPYPITMMLDELRIERVVANLLGNALKYAPSGSGIVVQLEARALAAEISVTDAGTGLMAWEIKPIFDRYHRGGNAHHLERRGLGLYVSKTIVEAHGGQIGVDRVEGAGSRFYFELPATTG
jgi:K+-sensing histidine kinase KdpD